MLQEYIRRQVFKRMPRQQILNGVEPAVGHFDDCAQQKHQGQFSGMQMDALTQSQEAPQSQDGVAESNMQVNMEIDVWAESLQYEASASGDASNSDGPQEVQLEFDLETGMYVETLSEVQFHQADVPRPSPRLSADPHMNLPEEDDQDQERQSASSQSHGDIEEPVSASERPSSSQNRSEPCEAGDTPMHDRYASSQVQVSHLEEECPLSSDSDHEYDSADCSCCSEFEKLPSQEPKKFGRYGSEISEVTEFVIPSIISMADSKQLSGNSESEQNLHDLQDESAEQLDKSSSLIVQEDEEMEIQAIPAPRETRVVLSLQDTVRSGSGGSSSNLRPSCPSSSALDITEQSLFERILELSQDLTQAGLFERAVQGTQYLKRLLEQVASREEGDSNESGQADSQPDIESKGASVSPPKAEIQDKFLTFKENFTKEAWLITPILRYLAVSEEYQMVKDIVNVIDNPGKTLSDQELYSAYLPLFGHENVVPSSPDQIDSKTKQIINPQTLILITPPRIRTQIFKKTNLTPKLTELYEPKFHKIFMQNLLAHQIWPTKEDKLENTDSKVHLLMIDDLTEDILENSKSDEPQCKNEFMQQISEIWFINSHRFTILEKLLVCYLGNYNEVFVQFETGPSAQQSIIVDKGIFEAILNFYSLLKSISEYLEQFRFFRCKYSSCQNSFSELKALLSKIDKYEQSGSKWKFLQAGGLPYLKLLIIQDLESKLAKGQLFESRYPQHQKRQSTANFGISGNEEHLYVKKGVASSINDIQFNFGSK